MSDITGLHGLHDLHGPYTLARVITALPRIERTLGETLEALQHVLETRGDMNGRITALMRTVRETLEAIR